MASVMCFWIWCQGANTKQKKHKKLPEKQKLFGQKHESISFVLNNLPSRAPLGLLLEMNLNLTSCLKDKCYQIKAGAIQPEDVASA